MKDSSIEWTDHTFNPWIGCQRVSEGCRNCYAETLAARYWPGTWGPSGTTARKPMSDNYWKQPVRWNAAAARLGERHRVFCASMADVFEDHPQVAPWRERLWQLIEGTPNLDWLLLTKRPQNIVSMVNSAWLITPPHNVWYGTSGEDKKTAEERILHLRTVPAVVRFVSFEPMLGPILLPDNGAGIHWVIAGGESGAGARPMHPQWARDLRDQCNQAGVPFFFKQWGAHNEQSARASKKENGRILDGRTHDDFPIVQLEATCTTT